MGARAAIEATYNLHYCVRQDFLQWQHGRHGVAEVLLSRYHCCDQEGFRRAWAVCLLDSEQR